MAETTVIKDWITESGLRAVILSIKHDYYPDILGINFHHTGYVAVGDDHPLHGKSYMHEITNDICVHGGLTYSTTEVGGKYPVQSDSYWFGFDCAHYQDNYPDGGQPLDYVVSECESLAKQLSDIK